MISEQSKKREIRDLQRLLISLGYLTSLDKSERGRWGRRTQAAVVAAYAGLGWDHPQKGKWITSPALAAIAASGHSHVVEPGGKTTGSGWGYAGPGTHASGPGTHASGPGTHASGPGTHASGPGTHASGPGTHASGPGTYAS